jgi:hypothetical protein
MPVVINGNMLKFNNMKLTPLLILLMLSCAESIVPLTPDPPTPEPTCFEAGYGSVEMLNKAGFDIIVTITSDTCVYATHEIPNDSSYTWQKVRAGNIRFWEQDKYTNGGFRLVPYHLDTCQNLFLSWRSIYLKQKFEIYVQPNK